MRIVMNTKGWGMKKTAWMIGATMAFVSLGSIAAQAQSYYSQQSRQNREYKSLQQSTHRAFGTTRSSSRTYTQPSTPSYSSKSRSYR